MDPNRSKKFTIVVSGPNDVLKNPIRKRTGGNRSFRHFLEGHVSPSKLVGLRVTRACGGNPKEAVTLDTKVKRFVEQKYTNEVRVYRVKLIRPLLYTNKSGTDGSREPEVITLDDDEEELFGDVDPSSDAVEGGGVNLSALKAEEDRENPVVIEDMDTVNADDSGVDLNVSAPLGDEQVPCSGEQIAHEAKTPTPVSQPSVVEKQEKDVTMKTEIPDPPESTFAVLGTRGVPVENLEAQTRRKIKNFSNPFLLILREEVRKLKEDKYKWQSIVGKAPRCAYLIDELFK